MERQWPSLPLALVNQTNNTLHSPPALEYVDDLDPFHNEIVYEIVRPSLIPGHVTLDEEPRRLLDPSPPATSPRPRLVNATFLPGKVRPMALSSLEIHLSEMVNLVPTPQTLSLLTKMSSTIGWATLALTSNDSLKFPFDEAWARHWQI